MKREDLMAEREYWTIDKSAWGEGMWTDEPDKIQFTDETTGLPCLIVRGPSGSLCGYVGVSEGHPWFGCRYDSPVNTIGGTWGDCPATLTEVHGALTYSKPCQGDDEEDRSICHIPEPGQPDHVWWFGFDCAHLGDLSPAWDLLTTRLGDSGRDGEQYRDVAYVRGQCASLAAQLATVGAGQGEAS